MVSDQQLWQKVSEGLPGYRLSKFQPLMPLWVERETLAGFLLDVGETWEWLQAQRSLSGQGAQQTRETAPEPQQTRETAPEPETAEPETAEPETAEPETAEPETAPEQTRGRERRARAGRDIARGPLGTPVEWVRHAPGLEAACARLAEEPLVALDVETTMYTQQLCLVQLCGRGRVYLIDPLEVEDLEPLRRRGGRGGRRRGRG